MALVDPVSLTRDLIKKPSVTPADEGAMDLVQAELGVRPEASTTGGTSDARFIRSLCPVLELGLVGQTMHQIDERVSESDLHAVTRVYRRVIDSWFNRFGG